jgi:membrane dipeptidase
MRILLSLVLLLSLFQTSAQRYKKIHQKAIVVDTHNDVLINILQGLKIEDDLRGQTHSDLKRFKDGGVDVQIFSIWSDEKYGIGKGFNYANRQIDSLYSVTNRNSNKMIIVKTPADFDKAIKQKKLGVMMGLEGGHMIEERLDYLDSLYNRGVRYMTLTWNNSTAWATSAADEVKIDFKPLNDEGKRGLTEHGKNIVRSMNELGMLVDLSHVGEKTFWDAIAVTTKPVIVSHSCVHVICPVPRNLKDDQIKAIGKNGGVIHLNFYSGFLDSTYDKRRKSVTEDHKIEVDSLRNLKWPNEVIEIWLSRKYPNTVIAPPLSVLVDHIDHIVKLIGVDHVGIGSDFDGISSSPQQMDDVTHLPNLTKALLERGYSKKDVRKILGENFIRIFKANSNL